MVALLGVSFCFVLDGSWLDIDRCSLCSLSTCPARVDQRSSFQLLLCAIAAPLKVFRVGLWYKASLPPPWLPLLAEQPHIQVCRFAPGVRHPPRKSLTSRISSLATTRSPSCLKTVLRCSGLFALSLHRAAPAPVASLPSSTPFPNVLIVGLWPPRASCPMPSRN